MPLALTLLLIVLRQVGGLPPRSAMRPLVVRMDAQGFAPFRTLEGSGPRLGASLQNAFRDGRKVEGIEELRRLPGISSTRIHAWHRDVPSGGPVGAPDGADRREPR